MTPLKLGEEFTFDLSLGKTLIIQLMAIGKLNEESKKRDVYFNLNGESRVVEVVDEEKDKAGGAGGGPGKTSGGREKADLADPKQISAPMAGLVVEMRVKKGSQVKAGEAICVLSAMKMETVVNTSVAGVVGDLLVQQSDNLSPGDLIARIEE